MNLKFTLQTLLTAFSILLFATNIQAQVPANNECSGAADLSSLFGGDIGTAMTSDLYDNTMATTEASDPTTGWECWGEPTGAQPTTPTIDQTIWFTFVGDGNTYAILTTQCNATDYIESGDTQFALYTGDCGALVPEACNEDDPSSVVGNFPAGLLLETTMGTTYNLLVDGFSGFGGSYGEFCIQVTRVAGTCDAGTLVTTGTVNVPVDSNFTVEVMNVVVPTSPTQGRWSWLFTPVPGSGSGAFDREFIIGGGSPITFDNDLNGALSGNTNPGPLPPMSGCWTVTSQVASDGNNPFNTVCSTGTDSLTVCFEDLPIPPCFASGLLSTDAQIVCDGGTFNIGVTSDTDTVPAQGGHGYFLDASQGGGGGLNASGNSFFILSATGVDNFTAELNGILDPTDGDAALTGTWVFRSFVHSNLGNPFNSICSISEDSMFVFFNTPFEVFNIADNGDNTATVIVNPLTETFTYLWDDPEGSTTSTTGTITESGTYNVTITNSLGCTITSSVDVNSTVSIEDVESLVKMEINPNPTTGDFNINLELAQSERIQIDLMSVTGKKVKSITNETSRGNMYQVKASDLPAGLYFVNFNVAGEQFTEKLIIK